MVDDEHVEIHDAAAKAIPAIYALAASAEPLAQRILNAYRAMVLIRPDSLPLALRDEYEQLIAHMTSKPARDARNPARATVEEMDAEELRDAAERIIRFYGGIRKEAYRRQYQCREH